MERSSAVSPLRLLPHQPPNVNTVSAVRDTSMDANKIAM